jgi:hypothetical protein
MFFNYFFTLPKLNARYGISVNKIIMKLTHSLILLPHQTITCISFIDNKMI